MCGGSLVVARAASGAEKIEMDEHISLWKAPTSAFSQEFMLYGFAEKYFRIEPGIYDGKAYFAKTKTLARDYSWCYGAGIIEVRMKLDDYASHFIDFEQLCPGTVEIEIAIPRERLNLLNRLTLERILHHD